MSKKIDVTFLFVMLIERRYEIYPEYTAIDVHEEGDVTSLFLRIISVVRQRRTVLPHCTCELLKRIHPLCFLVPPTPFFSASFLHTFGNK